MLIFIERGPPIYASMALDGGQSQAGIVWPSRHSESRHLGLMDAPHSKQNIGMRRTIFSWIGVGLALVGPGTVSWLWRPTIGQFTLRSSLSGLCAFCLLLSCVTAIAKFGEGLSLHQIGFRGTSWRSAPFAIVLALFFIFIFGPIAGAVLANVAPGAFGAGERSLERLPIWYIWLTIIVVAAGEEWLYRGYAIERLETLTGSTSAAGVLSLLMFAIAHLPLWGLGVALSTLASGAVFTVIYIWRRDIVALAAAHVLVDLYGLTILRLVGAAS